MHEWLREAGFNWALDAREWPAWAEQPRHTLADALQRLFLGYAAARAGQRSFQGLLGTGDAEGSRATALGAFWRFAHRLQRAHDEMQLPKPPMSWARALFELLDDFVQVADDELESICANCKATFGNSPRTCAAAGVAQPLPLEVVCAALQQQLDDTDTSPAAA